MASGPVLARDGDVYGPVVNMASRLVTVGRAGAVNVSQELRDALAGDRRFALRSLGDRSLRHIGNVRVYFPPDANSLLSVADHCLRSRNYVNVIVAGKQSQRFDCRSLFRDGR